MTKEQRPVPKKRRSMRMPSALNRGRLAPVLDELAALALYELYYGIRDCLDFSVGDPTAKSILEVRDSLPLVGPVLDFDVVLERLNHLDRFERTVLGVPLYEFVPELSEIKRACIERICLLPRGIEKAEAWLNAVAMQAGADAALEAAIYLASRGKNVVDANELQTIWQAALCSDIGRGRPVGKIPKAVLARARRRDLSLAEAEQVLRYNEHLPRFFSFRDEEHEHIDQTMFRAVEWLGVAGFHPWLESHIAQVSTGPQDGFDHVLAGWWLLYWCRSDLALEMADRRGLSAWLWTLMNGPHHRNKPWRLFWPDQTKPRMVDYVPLAGIVSFVWHRIRPDDAPEATIRSAAQLLLQTQLACGAWPLHGDDRKPCLMATYAAIHGLTLARPHGWQAVAKKAGKWLEAQQDDFGYWAISGGPTVAITVLVLDAIALARGNLEVTFGRGESRAPLSRKQISDQEYADILQRLRSVSTSMERSPATWASHDEEEIRDFLLACLNANYRGAATSETFNKSGRTDILIRVEDRNTFIAECKVWSGAKAFREAIDQLLGYLTWRDCKCALLIFSRNRNAAAVRAAMHKTITSQVAFDRTLVHDPSTDADSQYVLVQRPEEPQREIVVTTMLFDLPREKKRRKKRAKR